MAKVVIAGVSYELAPYKLAQLKQAAPFIDRINAVAGSLSTIEGMTDSACDFLGVLSVGLVKIDPALTLDALEEKVGLADITSLRDAFKAVLAESGLTSAGEAPAPVSAEATGDLPQASAPSSASLSPQE